MSKKLVIRRNDRDETFIWSVDAPPNSFERLRKDLNSFFAATDQNMFARIEEV